MTRLLDRARRQSLAWLVFFVIVVDLIGFGIVIPILPFLSPQLGGGTDDIAFILATYSVAAAIVAPVWGGCQTALVDDRFSASASLVGPYRILCWLLQMCCGWSICPGRWRG